jgi:hypothetical protein
MTNPLVLVEISLGVLLRTYDTTLDASHGMI